MEAYLPSDMIRKISYYLDSQTFREFLICDKRYYKSLSSCIVHKQSVLFSTLKNPFGLAVKYNVYPLLIMWIPEAVFRAPQEVADELHNLDKDILKLALNYLSKANTKLIFHVSERHYFINCKVFLISKSIIDKLIVYQDLELCDEMDGLLYSGIYHQLLLNALESKNLTFIQFLFSNERVPFKNSGVLYYEKLWTLSSFTIEVSKILEHRKYPVQYDFAQRFINNDLDLEYIRKLLRDRYHKNIEKGIHYAFRAIEWTGKYDRLNGLKLKKLLKINEKTELTVKIIQELFNRKLIDSEILLNNVVYNDYVDGFTFLYPKIENSLLYFFNKKRGTKILKFILQENIELTQEHTKAMFTNADAEMIETIFKYRNVAIL